MESRRRSLAKALSWRLIALIVTTAVGFVLTKSVTFAVSIGLVDSAIKILAYYLHERAWNRTRGQDQKTVPPAKTRPVDPDRA